ncbi:MAG: TylF/MycF/NovP-related O-methyltransferase [bacterium]
MSAGSTERNLTADLYLDLMKRCLTRAISKEDFETVDLLPFIPGTFGRRVNHGIFRFLRERNIEVVRRVSRDLKKLEEGRCWPSGAETMIGLKRLDNLQYCVTDVIRNKVPGDLIETGVWRGGAAIFMRAVLRAYDEKERIVWVADSFEGLPKPAPEKYPADKDSDLWKYGELIVSLEEVKGNFERYGLLDDQVRFLKGWFRDTLPGAPIERIAVLRLDGDMYESTMDALRPLYPKLSPGGYLIVDDYSLPACRKAVSDYRAEYGVVEEIQQIDWTGVFWKKIG